MWVCSVVVCIEKLYFFLTLLDLQLQVADAVVHLLGVVRSQSFKSLVSECSSTLQFGLPLQGLPDSLVELGVDFVEELLEHVVDGPAVLDFILDLAEGDDIVVLGDVLLQLHVLLDVCRLRLQLFYDCIVLDFIFLQDLVELLLHGAHHSLQNGFRVGQEL